MHQRENFLHPEAGFGFLPERGEMAQRIRAFDWRATSLGEPEQWPENLRTSLSLCLSSRFPILIWWGPDMRVLYNDAYIPFLGTTKHPAALGQPGAQCWSEIWGGIGPMLESVYRTGEATWSQDEQYFFDRALPREEVYVTFTYGPILSTDGITVEGVLSLYRDYRKNPWCPAAGNFASARPSVYRSARCAASLRKDMRCARREPA